MKKIFPLCIFISLVCRAVSAQQPDCGIDKKASVYYLNSLRCYKEFNYLQSIPLSSKYEQVQCIKVIYGLNTKQIYFTNSKAFRFHFDFCTDVLNYTGSLFFFNQDNYGGSKNREFLLANINYYSSCKKYTFEFFAGDKVSEDQIVLLYNKIKSSSYFPELYFVINSEEMIAKAKSLKEKINLIYPEEIYGGQKYQALNKEETYGYVKKIDDYEKEKQSIKEHDIVVLKTISNDMPLVAGVLTDDFQTPLSHINVLSHNRKTPNACSKGIWNSGLLDSLNGKLVHYAVKDNYYILKPAELKDAEKFWTAKKSINKYILKKDTAVKGLLEMSVLSRKTVHIAGGKASNMAELYKITVDGKPLPVPEGAFAIPFYYYEEHIRKNDIQKSINEILNTDSIKNNYVLLDKKLKHLRKLIKKAPLDTVLLGMIEKKIRKGKYKAMRFRSSTNAEDIPGFNGAGLYDSKTGILDDSVKTIEKAVKQVWASLWNMRAFQEREYYHIDHSTAAMAILVHRSFGAEAANGVAITKNLYRDNYPGCTINVQAGEVSVVSPPENTSCDQIIVSNAHVTDDKSLTIEYLNRSNVTDGKTVLTQQELEVLNRLL